METPEERMKRLNVNIKDKITRQGPTTFGYCRVSTHKQMMEGQSIDAQKGYILSYCKNNNIPIKEEDIYIDVISGKDMARPEFAKMMENIDVGDTLITKDLSRLGRCTRDLLQLSDKLEKMNVRIIFLDGCIDTSTPSGKLFFTVIAAIRQFERESNAARTSSVMQHMKKNQGAIFGRAPFGYYIKDKTLVPNDNEQKVIDHITMIIYNEPHISVADIHKQLLSEEVKGRSGNAISYNLVSSIIKYNNLDKCRNVK